MNINKLIGNFKTYYQASSENRTGIHMFLAFVIIPAIGLSLLFIIVYNFLCVAWITDIQIRSINSITKCDIPILREMCNCYKI